METATIEREIRDFIVEQFFFGKAGALPAGGSLLGTVIDSTGVLSLVSFIQERFGITVADEEVVPDNLDSVAHLAMYVCRKLEALPQQ